MFEVFSLWFANVDEIPTIYNYVQKHIIGTGQKPKDHLHPYLKRNLVKYSPLQSRYSPINAGSNLMDVTNSLVNQDVNIYGLCDKQLACTTCRVDIETLSDRLPSPSEEELDVLLMTRDFRQKTSRMACQVTITEDLDGMRVRIKAEKPQ